MTFDPYILRITFYDFTFYDFTLYDFTLYALLLKEHTCLPISRDGFFMQC